MKILFITHYDNMYGANKALYQLIALLKGTYGEEPFVVIPAKGQMTDQLTKIGVPYMEHPITQWQAVYSTPFRFMIKKWQRKKMLEQEVLSLYEKLKEERIDLIYSNSSVIGTGALLAEKLGCRHIWHIREFAWEHFHMKYFYPESRVRQLYEQAECLVTISDALKERYQTLYPDAKIRRIYDGVNGKDSCDENKTLNGHPIRFCYVGYLFPMKHQEEVLEACGILERDGCTDYEVYLVGDGKKEYRDKLEKRIEQDGLSRVKMTGYLPDVHRFLKTMDVGLIASEYEGFGLVTVEYMLHRMPVIGRNSGGTPEIIVDRVTGYLYDHTEELAELMKQLIQHPESISAMGKAGEQRAGECFSEERNAEAVVSLIHGESITE